jgi:hypothetical protein
LPDIFASAIFADSAIRAASDIWAEDTDASAKASAKVSAKVGLAHRGWGPRRSAGARGGGRILIPLRRSATGDGKHCHDDDEPEHGFSLRPALWAIAIFAVALPVAAIAAAPAGRFLGRGGSAQFTVKFMVLEFCMTDPYIPLPELSRT